jgi:flagellar hook-length control protein FliK
MGLFKILFWAVSWLAAWLLLAKKTWVEFRKDLEWKTSEEKAKIFWEEILLMWKDLLDELKKLPENEQVQKLKSLWQEKLETLTDEIKNSWVKKAWELKEFWKNKLDELLPKLEKTLEEIKENWWKIIDEKISDAKKMWWEKINIAKKEVKKIFKKEENLWSKMTKIFKK